MLKFRRDEDELTRVWRAKSRGSSYTRNTYLGHSSKKVRDTDTVVVCVYFTGADLSLGVVAAGGTRWSLACRSRARGGGLGCACL
jgi:hypothetical protein